jgi:drug/metabolite transporter (DMT)-like permease
MAGGRRDVAGGVFTALAALVFGAIVTVGRSPTLRDVPVTSLLAVRFAAAAVVLALLLVLTRQPLVAARGERWRLVFIGVLGYGVESALFFLALGRGTAATVTLLFYTYPVWVTVLSALFGIGMPGVLVGGSLVAAVAGAGVVVASSGGLDISGLGVAFALVSALTISFFLIALQVLIRRSPPLVVSLWIAASAALAHGVYAVASGTGRLPAWPEEWVALVAMGVLTSGAFFFLFLGVRRLGAVRSSIIASLEPVAAALLALAFLGEPLRPGVVVGGTLILGAAITASLARGVPEPEAVP